MNVIVAGFGAMVLVVGGAFTALGVFALLLQAAVYASAAREWVKGGGLVGGLGGGFGPWSPRPRGVSPARGALS
jgi:hypothetical protein